MNGETVEKIERQLHRLLHTGALECCQLNVWMEKIAMRIGNETVFKPYISGTTASSGLIRDG